MSDALTRAGLEQLRTIAERHAAGGYVPGLVVLVSWSVCQAVQDNGTFGWDGGFGSTWRVDPVRDLVTIVLTQRMFDSRKLPVLHRELQDAACAALA